MNLAELKSKIIIKDIPHILVFTGPETGIMNFYIENITFKLNLVKKNIESVLNVFEQCSSKSMFRTKKVFVVKDDLDFLKNEKGWNRVKDLLTDNYLILIYHTKDSRLNFWKHFSDDVVLFEKLSSSLLKKHLSAEYGVSEENSEMLALDCDCDYIRCKLEMDKVVNLSKYKNVTVDKSFEICYNNNIICSDVNAEIQDFVDLCLKRNLVDAILLYSSIKQKNEPILKVISSLYNGFKNVLVAQTISSAKNIQQNTGINYYSYTKAKNLSGYYTNIELENLLYKLMQLEQDIKTGKIDQEIALDCLFINM